MGRGVLAAEGEEALPDVELLRVRAVLAAAARQNLRLHIAVCGSDINEMLAVHVGFVTTHAENVVFSGVDEV